MPNLRIVEDYPSAAQIGYPGSGKQPATEYALHPYPTRAVYLAGPMPAGAVLEGNAWRGAFVDMLRPYILPISPTRGIDDDTKFSRGLFVRDVNDIRTCDALVACFLRASRFTTGTVAEMGIAFALQKPVVLITEVEARVGAFVSQLVSAHCYSLREAADYINQLLSPGL